MKAQYNVDTGKFEPAPTECEVTIGWTIHPEGPRETLGYAPFMDPWQAGQPQHRITFTLTDPPLSDVDSVSPIAVAEACFVALNAPEVAEESPEGRILAAVQATGYKGEEAHYSLSVGDTVKVDGTVLACTRDGWVLDLTHLSDEKLDEWHQRMLRADRELAAPYAEESARRSREAYRTRMRLLDEQGHARDVARRAEWLVGHVEDLSADRPRMTVRQLLEVLRDEAAEAEATAQAARAAYDAAKEEDR